MMSLQTRRQRHRETREGGPEEMNRFEESTSCDTQRLCRASTPQYGRDSSR
jgi:hypothetical protein